MFTINPRIFTRKVFALKKEGSELKKEGSALKKVVFALGAKASIFISKPSKVNAKASFIVSIVIHYDANLSRLPLIRQTVGVSSL